MKNEDARLGMCVRLKPGYGDHDFEKEIGKALNVSWSTDGGNYPVTVKVKWPDGTIRNYTPSILIEDPPLVVFTSKNMDGTTFAFAPESQGRVREAFPDQPRFPGRVFVAHPNPPLPNAWELTYQQVIACIEILAGGASAKELAEKFGWVSFQDPVSEQETSKPLSLTGKNEKNENTGLPLR